MTARSRVAACYVVLIVALASAERVPAHDGQQQTCTPTTFRVPGSPTPQVVPASQDVRYGRCLFNSTTDFNQANPNNAFSSCSTCHPSGRTDRATHPLLISAASGTRVTSRQVPNLLNVQFNVPLGWDGRHGGVLGDTVSIVAAIKSAAIGAINSPVEMTGRIDPTSPADQAKLDALAAFLLSRSPVAPNLNQVPPPPKPPATPEEAAQLTATLARIKLGADVFFGRTASTQPLLVAGKACVSCHPPPFFTDNQVRTNILHPDAAYDFGFPQADGTVGPQDAGAGLTTVTDPTTGRSVQVGTFKTPSLHRFYPDGQPTLHGGIFAGDGELFRFYEKSLGFKLAPGEATGLRYWLVNCPQGPQRHPASIPAECN